MTAHLNPEERNKLVNLLAGLPEFQSKSDRIPLVRDSVVGTPRGDLLMQLVEFDGAPQTVASQVISRFAEYGDLGNGQEALQALLTHIRDYLSSDAWPLLDGFFQRQGWSTDMPHDSSNPNSQPEANSIQRVYVSYAWGGESNVLVDEFEQRLPTPFKLIRDKSAMRPGDWISKFMAEIGRAELVLVVLSDKYLHSVYCMSELLHLFNRSLGDRSSLMQRIVPLIVGELRCARARDRDAYVSHWEQEYTDLDALLKKRGIDSVGEADRRELLAIQAFKQQVSDLLAWVADTLMPQGVEVHSKGVEAAIELLQQRAATLRNTESH